MQCPELVRAVLPVNLPAAHAMQLAEEVLLWYVPVGQAMQSPELVCPVLPEYRPAAHALQLLCAVEP